MIETATKVIKLFKAETKAIDASRIHAIMSTETRDRDGDIIRSAGWDTDDFMQHPILLSSHNYGSLMSQIGHWEDVSVKNKQLQGIAKYYIGEGNPEADWGFRLASKGVAAYSVGFIPNMELAKEISNDGWFPNWEFNGQKLLETSHVTVPSNPEALQASVEKGLIHPQILDIYGVYESSVWWKKYDAMRKVVMKAGHGEHDHDGDHEGDHEHDKEDIKQLFARLKLLEEETGVLSKWKDDLAGFDIAGAVRQWSQK